jgi:uncharacterized phage-associated protein
MADARLIRSTDVARYFLARANEDGGLISPLKMQKLVYYAYVWSLVENEKQLFAESPQAWPRGPVFPSLYRDLKKYGSSPIPGEYIGDIDDVVLRLGDKTKILDKVYEKYETLTPFELVMLTHEEKPWKEKRRGMGAFEPSKKVIDDKSILEYYRKVKF